jgi:cell division septation protein DedD
MHIVLKRKLFGAFIIIAILAVVAIVLMNKTKVNQQMVTRPIPLPVLHHTAARSTKMAANVDLKEGSAVRLPVGNAALPVVKKNDAHVSLTELNNQASVKSTNQWVLKVAAFPQHQAASTLLDRLRNARFNAYLQTKSKGLPNPEYNVMIGPEMDQNAFVAVQAQLLRQFNIHAAGIQVVKSLNKG